MTDRGWIEKDRHACRANRDRSSFPVSRQKGCCALTKGTCAKIDTPPGHSYNPHMTGRLASLITIALGGILLAHNCTQTGNTGSDVSGAPLSISGQLASGAPIYRQTCATTACHGVQGEGIRSDDGFKVWPLVGEEFQMRHPNAQIVFDVIRSGDEPSLRALTDQEIYNAIAFELNQNQVRIQAPLTAANAFATYGGLMSGWVRGGIFPPSGNTKISETTLVYQLPIVSQNRRLRLQVDQIAEASAIGNHTGVFLVLVIQLSGLDDQPLTVSPDYLKLSVSGGEPLKPDSIVVQSAIEKMHTQTIKPLHGTVGLVVFALSALTEFDRLVYDDGIGNPLTVILRP